MEPIVNAECSKLIAMLHDEEVKAQIAMLYDALKSRAAPNSWNLVAYKHDCHKYYKYHRDSPKRYSMLVTSVDTQKTDEQAFGGKYLGFSGEHMVPKNSVVIEVCAAHIRRTGLWATTPKKRSTQDSKVRCIGSSNQLQKPYKSNNRGLPA